MLYDFLVIVMFVVVVVVVVVVGWGKYGCGD
jgi:hypothetical protein